MAVTDVPVGYLAASFSIPEANIHSLLSDPTPELVQTLLTQLEAKARTHDDLQSEKIRADVELEAAVQGGEQRARALKAAAEKAQKEEVQLRQKLAQEETTRRQTETELHTLKATATSSTSEVQALESRIKTLESQNRDALAMHEAKVAAHDRLAKELSEQHQKSLDLRKNVSSLEERNQTLESAATNVKFRETNLQQEIEQLRKNNDWYTVELKTRSDDHSRYRKEKNAQIAQLQRENADFAETNDSLSRTETLLRQHIDELKGKAEEDRLRIEELENHAARVESDHRAQLDNQQRLNGLLQQTAETAKKRLQDVQAEADRIQDEAGLELGQLQADVELERNRAAEAERRNADLDTLIESLRSEAADLKHSMHIPGTPRLGMNGSYGTPGRARSPAPFSPGGSQLKADASKTQLLIENNELKKDLRKAREKSEEQTAMVTEMLQELERRQPEFDELRRLNDALTVQITDITDILNEAISTNEAANREARKAAGDLDGVQKECAILRHQVQDMTMQLRSLLWRREAEANGLDSLPADQKQFVLESVNNQVPDHLIPNDSETHTSITKYLILYKNVAELQHQNSNLDRTIRQVGDEYDAQIARDNSLQHHKDHEEVGKLRSEVAEKDEQIKSLKLRSRTFKTERDMYCRIVTDRGHATSDVQVNSALAQSVPAGGIPLQLEFASQAKESAGYDKLVKDLQSHIDLLKEEIASERAINKSQVDGFTKDNGQLQSDKVRFESQVRREQDRYHRLEGTVKLLQSEKDTLQDRYNNIQDTLAKQDDRIVKVDQDFVEATTRIQGLESEMVYLRASLDVAKTIEARSKERSQELTDERGRLNKLLSDVQNLRNEQELANADLRHKLQNAADTAQVDLRKAERKLENEITEHRKFTQQRDYERSEAQRRIDDLIAARNAAEVKSATADSVRQQLEQQAKDLQSQLQAAEERVKSLQPQSNGLANGEEDHVSREEELTTQLSELQRKIERKQEDLESVNAQVTGFQNIAQDAEDRLQTFVEAHDRLQEELNLAQQEKDAIISDLQQRVGEISSELSTTTTELTELRGQHEQDALQLSQQKDTLEAEITRMQNDVNDYKAEAEAQAELVKTQADIAARAQQDYEHELNKHGDTMKKLRSLRDEHNGVKTEIAQFKAQAETARTALEQSQEHWQSTQSQIEGQITETKRRYDDLKQYNATLLKQFDDYKSQIDSLKSDRAVAAVNATDGEGAGSSNLQDIETYLRREKEIVEVQLNIKEQDIRRLEQQLTRAQDQLDQAREKLIVEQSKGQGLHSNATIESLQAQIEQINVYRESNTTLRNDNGRLQVQLAEKATALDHLQSEIEPLQARVSELEGELELNVGHLKQVEEDRDRWQKRHQDVLQRFDRIDPKDLEDLKQQIATLQIERDQALEQVNSLTEQLDAFKAAQEAVIEETRKATAAEVEAEKTKARNAFNKVHNTKMAQKKTEIDGLIKERDDVQGQLAVVQTEADEARAQVTAVQQQLEEAQSQVAIVQKELEVAKTARESTNATGDVDMGEEGQINETESGTSDQQLAELQQKLDAAQKQAIEAQGRANAADGQAGSLSVQLSLMRDRAAGLDKEVAEKGNRILELQNELSAARKQPPQPEPTITAIDSSISSGPSDEAQKLQNELTVARKDVEDLRSQLEASISANRVTNDEANVETSKENEEIVTLKASLDQREADLKQLEENLKVREDRVTKREEKVASIRDQANKKITDIREQTNGELENLRQAHQAEVERLRESSSNVVPAKEPPETTTAPLVAPSSDPLIEVEGLPEVTAEGQVVREFISKNVTANAILKSNIKTRTAHWIEENTKLKTEAIGNKAEIEKLKSQVQGEAIKSEGAQSQEQIHDLEVEIAKVKEEYESTMKETLDKEKQAWIQRGKDEEGKRNNVKMNMANRKTEMANVKFETVNTKWLYVQKAAKETPTEEVLKVYEQADKQQPAPKAELAAQSSLPAKPQNLAPAQPIPAQQPTTTLPANGTNAAMQPLQSAPIQATNPFPQQQNQAPGPNPFAQSPSQLDRRLSQPSFAGQPQAAFAQPPQVPQQQFQQAGRGANTNFQAMRGTLQSSIPRGGGGSNIPLPGGRGRGHQQLQQTQLPVPNATAIPGASQIGRGGGRGAGRGRGQQQQGQNNVQAGALAQGSPGRGGLNSGAQGFQPGGAGGGRGQKRVAEDDGDGAARGGKRFRGRGGGGGGGGAAGGAAGTE